MAAVCLNDVVFWTPPVAEVAECATASKQRHDHYSEPRLESLCLPTYDRHVSSFISRQTLEQPISLLSDVDNGVSNINTTDAGQNDRENIIYLEAMSLQ